MKEFSETVRTKEEAVRVLQAAGIMDEKGRIVEFYKGLWKTS